MHIKISSSSSQDCYIICCVTYKKDDLEWQVRLLYIVSCYVVRH
jgi:hypothetical protein